MLVVINKGLSICDSYVCVVAPNVKRRLYFAISNLISFVSDSRVAGSDSWQSLWRVPAHEADWMVWQ